MIRILTLLSLLFTLFAAFNCSAKNLYENCIYSYEFADVPKTNLVVRAIGDICYNRCNNECNAFSRKYQSIELNQDIIDRCMIVCRKGNKFSSTVREPFLSESSNGNKIYTWSKDTSSTATHCSVGSGSIDAADYIVYESQIAVKRNDKFRIDLIAPPGFEGNAVYLCGRQTTYLDVTDQQPSAITPSNRDIWDSRNPYYFDTKISPRDGDYLSIDYAGKHKYKCSTSQNCLSCFGKPKCICPGDTCKPRPEDYHLHVRAPGASNSWNGAGYFILPGGELELISSSTSTTDSEYPESSPGSVAAYNNNMSKIWKGLVPGISDSPDPHYGENVRHIFFSGYLGIPLDTGGTTPNYNFTNLSGGDSYSPRHARLGLRHFDGTVGSNYFDNQGGFYGSVSWKGCSQFLGNRLQYSTIAPGSKVNINDVNWVDLDTDDVIENRELTLDSSLNEGEIILRVKPYTVDDFAPYMPECNPSDSTCLSDLEEIRDKYNMYNAFGQYYISVVKSYDTLGVIKQASQIIRDIREYFFGNGVDDGLMQTLYKALISDTVIVNTIRAVLVFYIAFTGFVFMVGLSPINQREGAIRILKIGIVLMLISDTSWAFFYDGFFKLFIEGMTELIANIATPIYASDSLRQQILQDGSNVFVIFDEPLRILFSNITWKKILALMLTSILGLLIAIALGLACVISIMVMVKALIIYIVALVVLAILVILSPIFITLILFGYTKQMFDNWLKQMIVYTLQPIFVFTALSILLHLLIIGVKMSLSFTVCEVCSLGFQIPFKNEDAFVCLIPGYTTLFGAHMPIQSYWALPIANVGIVLYLLLTAQAMYAFVGFATSLAILIGSGQFVGFNLNEVVQNFRSFGILTNDFAGAIGLDKTSRSIRRQDKR